MLDSILQKIYIKNSKMSFPPSPCGQNYVLTNRPLSWIYLCYLNENNLGTKMSTWSVEILLSFSLCNNIENIYHARNKVDKKAEQLPKWSVSWLQSVHWAG